MAPSRASCRSNPACSKLLSPGSTWFQPARVAHVNHREAGAPCEIFVCMANGFDYAPAKVEAPKAEAPKK